MTVLSMVQLSVIIPTHRRSECLHTCLRHLEAQTVRDDLDVIVVDDVGDERTRDVANGLWQLAVTFVVVSPCQQGVARNEGLKHAKGRFVLFIGDDIFLEPDACEKHLRCLHSNWQLAVSNSQLPQAICHMPFAVLGFTTWDPACGITPVMRWLEKSGWQFGYPSIERYAHRSIPASSQHRYTYTSHISLPVSIAKKHLFRADVHLYGWEDVEWGMRLQRDGVSLVYEPAARALHHHHIDLADSLRRMETLGRSAVEIAKKVPDFDRVPRGWKRFAYAFLSLLPTMAGKHRAAFLRGLTQ